MVTVALFVVPKPGNRLDVILLVRNEQTVVPAEHHSLRRGRIHTRHGNWPTEETRLTVYTANDTAWTAFWKGQR